MNSWMLATSHQNQMYNVSGILKHIKQVQESLPYDLIHFNKGAIKPVWKIGNRTGPTLNCKDRHIFYESTTYDRVWYTLISENTNPTNA